MDSSEQDGRKGETITLPARDVRVIVRDGEEYTPEAIEQRSYPIPAHRVVGKLEAGMAIESAVAAERERCAKIAEAAGQPTRRPHHATEWPCNCETADQIAAKIRSGE